MKFQGYKYTIKLNASHRNSADSPAHSHTFEISMYINADKSQDSGVDGVFPNAGGLYDDDEVVMYQKAEDNVKAYFDKYSDKLLNDVPPFTTLNPTLENMADVFYANLTSVIEELGYSLYRLEISETPQRKYAVSCEEPDEKTQKRADALLEYLNRRNAAFDDEEPDEKPVAAAAAVPAAVPKEEKPVQRITPALNEEVPLSWQYVLGGTVLLVAVGFVVMMLVKMSGLYPLGFDIHGHLFKSELMYTEIGKGNFYPIYDEYWYNGLQTYRYWPPMTYYFMALLQFLAGGSVMDAYLGFIWASFVIGGYGWLLFGRRTRRPVLGIFMSLVWFFLPDNLRVFFGEGNMPRMFITMLLPLLYYFIWQFVCYQRKKMIIPVFITMMFCIFGHLMISAMIGVGSFAFLLIYAISNHRWKEPAQVILVELFGFAAAGIWVVPALVGGITSMDSGGNSDLMASLASKLTDSLNPLIRFDNVTELYLGLSVAVIAVLGLFLSNRKSLPGFLSLLIVIAGTTTALTPLIQKLPMSRLFWVRRFMPIAYAMFGIGLVEWKKLKKPIAAVMCLLIAVDCIPSADLSQYDRRMNIPATVSQIERSMIDTEITQAKNITKSRISIMDLSALGPMPSYVIPLTEPKTKYVFGWAWQGSATAENIVAINEALERENYVFMFDRNKELGADSVIVDKGQLKHSDSIEKLYAAAEKTGYIFAGETDKTILFSLYVSSEFGIITDYRSVAIGSNAAIVPMMLPYYRVGDKNTIDEYTVDELAAYDNIYLSGFFYNSKAEAERIVTELADRGVKVYIDMSTIPADPLTNRMTFLDVSAQPIVFYGSFPTLITDSGNYEALPFDEEYPDWNTVYLNGLEESDGYAWFNDTKLDFIGRGESENITFVGFNLLFHAYTTADENVTKLLGSVMDMDTSETADRTLVPISVTYEHNKIIIDSEYDNVNTTIAWQDNFSSEQNIREAINLLVVDKGRTVITIHYPYFGTAAAVSAVGLVLEAAMFIWIFHIRRKERSV